MSSDKTFRDMICKDPTDLDARGVFADWLMEQGDPRGTFIAQQIELAQMTGFEKNYPERLASTLRLQAAHGQQWLAEILQLIPVKQSEYGRITIDSLQNAVFKNGFVQRLAIKPQDISSNWKKLTALEPVTGIELLVSEALHDDSFNPPVAKTWNQLKVSPEGWVTAFTISQILNWDLSNLNSLDLSGCDLGVDGACMLVGQKTTLGDFHETFVPPPPLSNKLRHLKLMNTKLTDEGLQLLLDFKPLQALESLDIAQCGAAEQTLESLKKLKKLKSLNLSGNQCDLSQLEGWPVLKKLESLSLPQSVTEEMFQAIFPAPSPKLKELRLSSAKDLLKNPKLVASAAKKWLHLDVGSSAIGDAGLQTLLGEKSMKSVVHLFLNKCGLSDDGVASLLDCGLKRLVTLDISSNKLTDASIEQLAASDLLNHLAHLRIRNNRKLTAKCYEALAAADEFQPVSFDIGKCKDTKVERMLVERFGDAMVF